MACAEAYSDSEPTDRLPLKDTTFQFVLLKSKVESVGVNPLFVSWFVFFLSRVMSNLGWVGWGGGGEGVQLWLFAHRDTLGAVWRVNLYLLWFYVT